MMRVSYLFAAIAVLLAGKSQCFPINPTHNDDNLSFGAGNVNDAVDVADPSVAATGLVGNLGNTLSLPQSLPGSGCQSHHVGTPALNSVASLPVAGPLLSGLLGESTLGLEGNCQGSMLGGVPVLNSLEGLLAKRNSASYTLPAALGNLKNPSRSLSGLGSSTQQPESSALRSVPFLPETGTLPSLPLAGPTSGLASLSQGSILGGVPVLGSLGAVADKSDSASFTSSGPLDNFPNAPQGFTGSSAHKAGISSLHSLRPLPVTSSLPGPPLAGSTPSLTSSSYWLARGGAPALSSLSSANGVAGIAGVQV